MWANRSTIPTEDAMTGLAVVNGKREAPLTEEGAAGAGSSALPAIDQPNSSVVSSQTEWNRRFKHVLDLDRRLNRAFENGRGLQLSMADVYLLAGAGALDCISSLRSKLVEEKVSWHRSEKNYTGAVISGSITTEAAIGCQLAPTSTSAGTTARMDASAARARAKATFG
jgi:hypothetical protein